MREMKDSGIEWIGEIPDGWKRTKLLNLLRQSICDGPHETPTLVADGIPFISVDSLNSSERVDLGKCKKFISEEDYHRYKEKANVEENDILFTKAATIGKTAIVGKETFMVWSPIAIIKTDSSIATNKYVYHLLNCYDLIKYISLLGSYNTQINVGMRELEQAIVPLPPLIEQQRIADYLDQRCAEIDAVIERTKATIEEYKKLKQSIITEAVTKGVRGERALKDTGVEWIRIVPVDWEMVRGKGLFVETNTRSTTGEEELLTVSQYTGVTPRSQKNVNMFEAESLEGYKICKVGDIAANTMWLWAGAIGVSEYEGVISPSYNLYRQSGENYNPKYLDYLLRCTPLVQCYESMSTGIRASRLRLYPQQFLSIKFPVPPMAEQVEIVAYLDKKCAEMDALIARKTALLTEMESYKKSVIYEYVTGKKEVK